MGNAEAKHLAFLVAEEDRFTEPLADVAFLALRNGQCKYPLGGKFEPASRFCGCDAPIGSPYCMAHRAIAYLPSRAVHFAAGSQPANACDIPAFA